jgi:hypothetical protein
MSFLIRSGKAEDRCAEYAPRLDNLPYQSKLVVFDNWWEKIVFVDKNQNQMTRKDVVLYVSNQDGGAH